MAIATTDYSDIFSAVFTEKFRQTAVMVGLADRTYEADARISGNTKIPVSAANPSVASDYDADTPANYADPNDSGAISYLNLNLNQVKEINAALTRDAVRTIRAPLVVDMANEIAEDIAVQVEDYIFDNMIAPTTDQVASADSATFGTSSVFITAAGVPNGTDADKLVYDALVHIRRRAGAKKQLGRSGSGNRYAVVMHTLLSGALSEYLIRQGVAGELGYDLIAARNIGAAAGYIGTFMGMDLYETVSADKTREAASGKAGWQIYGFPYGSYAYGEMPVLVNYWTPDNNPHGAYHRFAGVNQYGAVSKGATTPASRQYFSRGIIRQVT